VARGNVGVCVCVGTCVALHVGGVGQPLNKVTRNGEELGREPNGGVCVLVCVCGGKAQGGGGGIRSHAHWSNQL